MTVSWIEIPTPEEVEDHRKAKMLKHQIREERATRELAPLLTRLIIDLIEEGKPFRDWKDICNFLAEVRPHIKLTDINTTMLLQEITPLFESKGWGLETKSWCNPPRSGLYWWKKADGYPWAKTPQVATKSCCQGFLSRLFGCGGE